MCGSNPKAEPNPKNLQMGFIPVFSRADISQDMFRMDKISENQSFLA